MTKKSEKKAMIKANKQAIHRTYGEDRTTHSRLVLKVPPPELIALREELPLHKDIYDYAIKGSNFEDCMARIAEKLDILLDGLYNGDKLCGVLLEALRNRRFHGNQPHLRAPGLVNVELVERAGSVTLEAVKEGTIAPPAIIPEQHKIIEFVFDYIEYEGSKWKPWPSRLNIVPTDEELKDDVVAFKRKHLIVGYVCNLYGIEFAAFRTSRGRVWDVLQENWRTFTSHPQKQEQQEPDSQNPAKELLPSSSESAGSEEASSSDKADLPQKH